MKILVFGAGSLGSLMAARLHEAGQDVSLLARGQRLEDLKKHGIVIREKGSEELEVAQVNIVEKFEPDDYYDLVMIVMRKNHADKILDDLAKNNKVPVFLFMGNNAEGPEEMIQVFGKERLMLGFPLPGGHRDGHLVEVLPVNEKKKYTIPLGEVDGKVRDRTRDIANTLSTMRGFKVQIRKDMINWLKYHVALLMSGFVPAIYAADINMKRLGETRDLIVLAVRATKEAIRGLRKSGIPTSPPVVRVIEYIPEPLLVGLIGWMMRKEFAKSSVEGHPRDARDEMTYLYDELMSIIDKKNVKTDAIDELSKYYDPNTPSYPEGKRELSLKWGGILTFTNDSCFNLLFNLGDDINANNFDNCYFTIIDSWFFNLEI
ncbi:ketopantoate reductase family protein [Natronospora cellulosivora (SeqCode)]